MSDNQHIAQAEKITAQLHNAKAGIEKIIIGQNDVVEAALVALLSGGHFLLTGLPGLGKTKLVDTLGIVLGLETRRIQCTPDLMPADILGTEVLDDKSASHKAFRFLKGPVFSQLLMADEINRASPRTQSALLQAMQEKQVTIGGENHALPTPFHVMATQNPLELEGTYPLPEAQLDRFMLQVVIRYPEERDEKSILLATTGRQQSEAQPCMTAEDLVEAQALVRSLPVGDSVVDAILKLVRAGRPEQTSLEDVRRFVKWGPGPRSAQAFMLAIRARALLDGRLTPSIEDVIKLAPAILSHRMAMHFTARAEGHTVESIIRQMCDSLHE